MELENMADEQSGLPSHCSRHCRWSRAFTVSLTALYGFLVDDGKLIITTCSFSSQMSVESASSSDMSSE
ncbi:unnamed protein product [Haemonchus placei]|uniref:ZP domain-containing protein n=1 Tax=Haemonchus placei TaxID=6290 RepID=A0A0N4X5R7_HAEPC|nr:unnamed protein product [Haemonchus placei]